MSIETPPARYLPGQVSTKPLRYQCFLCEKIGGIFAGQFYGLGTPDGFFVCHACTIETMTNACKRKRDGTQTQTR